LGENHAYSSSASIWDLAWRVIGGDGWLDIDILRCRGKIRNQLERILGTGGFTGPQYAVNTVGRTIRLRCELAVRQDNLKR
jgi:hypothetical protein